MSEFFAAQLEAEPSAPGKPLPLQFPVGSSRDVEQIMGVPIPSDIGWKECPKYGNGSGLTEARLVRGRVELRGEVVYTYSNVGSFSNVRRLPDGFPHMLQEALTFPVYAIESGVSYRIGLVRINGLNEIAVAAPTGKFTSIRFDGVSWPVY